MLIILPITMPAKIAIIFLVMGFIMRSIRF
jgi:hypothetical protein